MTSAPAHGRTTGTTPPGHPGRTPARAWVLCCVLAVLAAPVLLLAAVTLSSSGGGDPFEPLSTTGRVVWAVVALLAVAVPALACRLTLRSGRAALVVGGVLVLALVGWGLGLGLVALP